MEKVCNQCPRHCKVDRTKQVGFCGAGNNAKIAKTMLHHWEEPIISGAETDAGSGAIFFSHCNLKCVYCQNYEISHFDIGTEVTANELAEIFKKFEEQKALNINLVTPSHYSKAILSALKIYKPKIPVVWNTGGYDDEKVIESLKGYVDIFLTDLKYYSNELALKYSNCSNYFEIASKALLKMREVCKEDEFENGLMKKGVIVRHLVLPNQTKDSKQVLNYLAKNLGTKTFLSLMSQYTPHGKASDYPELNRKLKPLEYKIIKNHMLKLGFENGFVQNLTSASESFIPEFLKRTQN